MLNLSASSSPEPKCELFGVLGIIIQALLGFLSFSTLIIKRYQEKKRRPWLIWGMDTSKQAFGACYQHILNLWVAVWLGGLTDSPCKWYFLNYMMDIMFGTILNYLFFTGIERFCANFRLLKFKSGVYFTKEAPEKPLFLKWIYQFVIWILVLTMAKFSVILASYFGRDALDVVGEIILTPIRINVNFELIMIMVVLPFLFNAGQFWVQDNFLKKQEKPKEKMIEVNDYTAKPKVNECLIGEDNENGRVEDLNSTICSDL